MNVITGSARGAKLIAPKTEKTRPTSGLVKEAIFNIIQFEIKGAKILDLFAGSGQLGIEALSRGAAFAVLVDNSRDAINIITKNLKHTKLRERAKVKLAEADSFLKSCDENFDVVLLDPPYSLGLIEKMMPEVMSVVVDSGVIVCEISKKDNLRSRFGNFELTCLRKYGIKQVGIFRNVRGG